MQAESSRNDIQGTVGDRRERELLDVAGTPRRSDTVQQGVAAAVSFTVTRAPTTSVQGWQEGNQGILQMILAELQATGQRQTEMQTSLTCWMREGKESLAHLQQCQAAMEAQMLQQTAAMREGKDSLAHLQQQQAELQQRLEKMGGQMQQQAEAMDDLQDVLEDRLDEVQQQARESEAKTLDTLGALDSKIDKLTHVQEQQTKMHTAQFMDLQEATTKARGKIHEFDRDVERLRVECRTAIHQLRQELDGSFRNEMEKIKDNELASITHQLSEIESGKNKKLTVSMRTMLEASVQEIQQEFGQRIEGESNLLRSEILNHAVRIRNYCDVSCAVIKGDYQKELTVLAQRTDKTLADRQKKLDRSLRAMGKKYTGSQKELNNALQGLEETLLTKDAAGKSTGVTEALERRFESETKELDNKIKELDTKLKSLDNVVQHHERRREKLESLKKVIEKHENELAAQKSTLEAHQSATQGLPQDVEELRQTLGSTVKDLRTAQLRVETRIQAMQSESDQRVDEGIQSRARRKHFEWHKWIMQDAVEKAHTVLRKLLRQLGVVCSFYLNDFYSRYSGSNEAYLNEFCSKITNASSMGNYLKDKLGPQQGKLAQDCCLKVMECCSELETIIRNMNPTWDTFSYYIAAGGLQKFRESIEKCLDSGVRALAELKYVVDKSFNKLSHHESYEDIISRELYKEFGATGLDRRPVNWIFSRASTHEAEVGQPGRSEEGSSFKRGLKF